ncbi:hypothetical protein C8R45DRAFT_1090394 [Mycena sanguinolenta]|nr:hypothetical protein C8R45DRAFT_1090394 [Mycena sanguinolenta]
MSSQADKSPFVAALYPPEFQSKQIADEVDLEALSGNFELDDPFAMDREVAADFLRSLGCDNININVREELETLNIDMSSNPIYLQQIVDEVDQALTGDFEFDDLLPMDMKDLDMDFLRFSGSDILGEMVKTLNPRFSSTSDNITQSRDRVVDAPMHDVERAIAALAKAGPDELDTLDDDDAALVKRTLDAVGGCPMEYAESGSCDMQGKQYYSAGVLNTVLCDDFQNLKIKS